MSLSLILFKQELSFEDIEQLMAIGAVEITPTAYATDKTPVPPFRHPATGKPSAVVLDLAFPDHDVHGLEPTRAGEIKGMITRNFRTSLRTLQTIGS